MNIDLTAQHGPITLKSPIVVGACPLTAEELQQIALVGAGAGAIVLPSLFEEQVAVWQGSLAGERNSAGVDDAVMARYGDVIAKQKLGSVDDYLGIVQRSSERLPIPVIASLNGTCQPADWSAIGKQLEIAGATAIEFHVRRPLAGAFGSHADFESQVLSTAAQLKQACSIPVFLKLSRDRASLYSLACRLESTVDGLVLFGRSPVFDIQLDQPALRAEWGLTPSGTIKESLHSIMQLRRFCPEISISASGGIGDSTDLAKAILAGADTAMVTSAIYRDGATAIEFLLDGLTKHMECLHVTSLAELKAKGAQLFDRDTGQFAYLTSMSENVQTKNIPPSERTTASDRWGHVRPS